MIFKLTLTLKMLVMTALVGLVVWAVSDNIQTQSLKNIFHAKLMDRFTQRASEERLLFDRHVKSLSQVAGIIAASHDMHGYLRSSNWLDDSGAEVKYYTELPPWYPGVSLMSRMAYPKFAILLDNTGRVREVYSSDPRNLPEQLVNMGSMLGRLSSEQSYFTYIENEPYLTASKALTSIDYMQVGVLLVATPLDVSFMIDSQGPAGTDKLIALVQGDSSKILISSNPELLAPGTQLESQKGTYLLTGEGYFENVQSDELIKFISLVSNNEVEQLTAEVLEKDRQLRAFTAFAFIGAFALVMLWITQRIQLLTQRVVDFSERMELTQPELKAGDQLKLLEARFKCLTEEIQTETAALEHQAHHDPLTDLPNRKFLHDHLQQAILSSRKSADVFVLIMSDLNHFKEINDTLGHHIGDLVLQQASNRLHKFIKPGDIVARLGGDEFGLLLHKCTAKKAAKFASSISKEFEEPFHTEGHNLSVGISMGIVEFPADGDDVNILVQRADVAMYLAKKSNSSYAIYDPQNDQHTIGKLELMTEFRRAIEQESLQVYFQPMANIRNGEIVSAEALLRWDHPLRGYIPPDEFIPLAEQTGLINQLTNWLMQSVVKQIAEWNKHGINISVSMNLSAHCLQDSKLPARLRSILVEQRINPAQFILEITESDIMTDPHRAKEILSELDSMGIGISIDDFGTGYSSLAYLKQLPVDEIKIDKSFVMEMAEDENDAVIVRATIDLAHNLGLKIIAEGVEDKTTWQMLNKYGCDIAQGYLISAPLPSDEFLYWAKDSKWPFRSLYVVNK